MATEKKITGRGGARPGAGRKPLAVKKKKVNFLIKEETADAIDVLANGKLTKSEVIEKAIDLLIKKE